ncbi:MAG TPA: hypothetical protein DEP45_09905 [Armatimonadetes bacterium]|nr:hypothetical protein [Armatimonadota bacterium]
MYALIYFDTEDFVSPPDHPVHQLPGQFAQIMTRHGLPGCFHIHGEKARFMERHGQREVIEAVSRHDVSLHYDRGSIHPTTAEEVSQLPWFEGIARTIFRELPGFQALERIFGKCSSLTQHGGTFAAQIVYAAGKLGMPFFYSPFRLPGRNVVWYCQNLLIGGYQAGFHFDTFYRDTPKFEEQLGKVDGYLSERAREYGYTAMFGCHPIITIMKEFPCCLNWLRGSAPEPERWVAPEMIEGVSIPLIMQNFERLVQTLVAHPDVQWTDVAGITQLFGARPVRVSDEVLLRGAEAVHAAGGPTFTDELSAAELLFLLARRLLRPAGSYEVPQVMGPNEPESAPSARLADVPAQAAAEEITHACYASGYLPARLSELCGSINPEQALLVLASEALGRELPPADAQRPTVDAIPGVPEALKLARNYRNWRPHGLDYRQTPILEHLRRQCWTLKPALLAEQYGEGVELGRHLNPMFERPE